MRVRRGEFIYTSHHFTPHGRYELNKLASLPMCGFIAQLVEHRTGIVEVTGRIPLKPWFFQASSFQLLKLENLLRWSFFTLILSIVQFIARSVSEQKCRILIDLALPLYIYFFLIRLFSTLVNCLKKIVKLKYFYILVCNIFTAKHVVKMGKSRTLSTLIDFSQSN